MLGELGELDWLTLINAEASPLTPLFGLRLASAGHAGVCGECRAQSKPSQSITRC